MSQSNDTYNEITFHHEPAESTSRIWKTFWVLLIITLIELGLGLSIYAISMGAFAVLLIKGIMVILTLAKAFYIISIFMHLGDELRNMIMTIAIPALLFVWFIGAFLWDGNSFKNLRNEFDPYKVERSKTKAEQPAAHGEKHQAAPAEGSVH